VSRHLNRHVAGGAKTVESQPSSRLYSTQTQTAVANDSSAKQGCGLFRVQISGSA